MTVWKAPKHEWPVDELRDRPPEREGPFRPRDDGERRTVVVRKEPIDDEPAVYDCIQANLTGQGGRNA